MAGPEVLYSIWKLMKKGNLSHEVAPRSVFYGHNFIEEAKRSTGERVVGGWEGETEGGRSFILEFSQTCYLVTEVKLTIC